VPACTYYREASLAGEFRLCVHLQMDKGFPPTAKAGDYWWGSSVPIRFPVNGEAHTAAVEEVEIMLEPVL